MGTLTKVLVAFAGLLLAAGPANGQPAPLAFGVLNQQSPALTAERWNPILHYVGTAAGIPLQLRMGRTVQETDAMMARGDFDFVFTNHNFQSDFDAVPFKVLARRSELTHHVLIDSAIHKGDCLQHWILKLQGQLQHLLIQF